MGQGRIVIVDHDEDVVKSLSGMLSDAGFKVSSTTDGSAALTLIRTVDPSRHHARYMVARYGWCRNLTGFAGYAC